MISDWIADVDRALPTVTAERLPLVDIQPILTPEQRARRLELEELVLIGETLALRGARALRELRDARLYRSTHATFEGYGQDALRLTRARLYQLINWADAADAAEVQGIEINSERMARALGLAPPEHYGLVVAVTQAATGKERPSSADIAAVGEVVRDMAQGMVEHPATRQSVPFAELPPERKAEAVVAAVQAGAKDRRDFQGVDDIKPWDWLDGLRTQADVSVVGTKAGWQVSSVDRASGEVLTGPLRPNQWDAIRAAKLAWEGVRE
ncbi:hypothetical protein [Deinococcus sp.]|uniref:hypothetical protein n=1 Tax=Deinococcus sp. TaxID=47478 RepID=UPI0025CC6DCD|nr:hypothetical protein [Deinococcus sp.]